MVMDSFFNNLSKQTMQFVWALVFDITELIYQYSATKVPKIFLVSVLSLNSSIIAAMD